MARFIGIVEGSGKEVTRLGSPSSGIRASARGWALGVTVYGRAEDDADVFDVWTDRGSRMPSGFELLGHVRLEGSIPVFYPSIVSRPEPEPVDPAYQLGLDAGRAAGSWVIDGNTKREQAAAIVWGYNDGDPATMDMQPAPLSGEWADGATPRSIADELELDDDDDIEAACDRFEEGYSEGYWRQVLSDARAAAGF